MLLSGGELVAADFFKGLPFPLPRARASSFDLSIGYVFDEEGNDVSKYFVLKPGCMVQVVSAEVFNLPRNVTGHVTYKTDMTRRGIWALTVGIVDPGWTCPIATTLLNFGKTEYLLQKGQSFLRVSLIRHGAIDENDIQAGPDHESYMREIRSIAVSRFPKTFLDSEGLAEKAGKDVFEKLRSQGLAWLGGIAIIFTVASLISAAFQVGMRFIPNPDVQGRELSSRIDRLTEKLEKFESSPHLAPPPEPVGNGQSPKLIQKVPEAERSTSKP